MKTDLEKQFFIAFGIEPTHEDACKLADKYWGNEELAEKYYVFDRYIEKNCPIGGKECFSTCKYAYDNIEYPQITDRILLELICIINKRSDFGLFSSKIDELKDEILDHCLVLIGNDTDYTTGFEEEIKSQVQALFKE